MTLIGVYYALFAALRYFHTMGTLVRTQKHLRTPIVLFGLVSLFSGCQPNDQVIVWSDFRIYCSEFACVIVGDDLAHRHEVVRCSKRDFKRARSVCDA